MDRGSLRLLLFVDPALASSVALLASSLKTAAARDDVEIAAIVDTARRPSSRLRLPRALAGWGVRRVCNLNTEAEPADNPLFLTIGSLARRRRIPVLAPRELGVNDSGFVEAVQRLEPDATIALMVAQIFLAPLLAACGTPVNYHDGLLPRYQGVAATAWSIYEGASQSGFSFHRMSDEVDRGSVLLQGSLPLDPDAVTAPVLRAKTALAASKLSTLFDLLLSGPGDSVAQDQPGSSFSRADLRAIRAVDEPGALSLGELELRLRAFETIDLTLACRSWSTTALRRITHARRSRRLAFTTADGVAVEPSRLMHLPPPAYRLFRSALGPA
jgi:Formyl transferase